MGNGVKLTADASWSRAKRDELSLENNTQRLPAPQLDSVDLAFRSGGFSQPVKASTSPTKMVWSLQLSLEYFWTTG